MDSANTLPDAKTIMRALKPSTLEGDVFELTRVVNILETLTEWMFDPTRWRQQDGTGAFSITFQTADAVADVQFLVGKAGGAAKRLEERWTDLHNAYCEFDLSFYRSGELPPQDQGRSA